MAAPPMWEHLALLGTFGVGAFLMRGAGCTINDILDKDFDSKVERTKTRPLASGALTRKQVSLFIPWSVVLQLIGGNPPVCAGGGIPGRAADGGARVSTHPQPALNWGGRGLVGPRRHLSPHEAHHLLATGLPRVLTPTVMHHIGLVLMCCGAYGRLTFNYGAILGWTAATGGFDPSVVLPLYTSGICWTLIYDTIYAHQARLHLHLKLITSRNRD
jgi:4-hydroxybenzoate polyprenyltransferase